QFLLGLARWQAADAHRDAWLDEDLFLGEGSARRGAQLNEGEERQDERDTSCQREWLDQRGSLQFRITRAKDTTACKLSRGPRVALIPAERLEREAHALILERRRGPVHDARRDAHRPFGRIRGILQHVLYPQDEAGERADVERRADCAALHVDRPVG